jgi:plasmid stabilization system protein ParE
MLPVRLRERALDDLDAAAAYYDEHAAHMTPPFIDAFLTAKTRIAHHPRTGSNQSADIPQHLQH